jgi:beta-phosphoglucomutase-like phosphatase (HAD superfamily)
MISDNIQFYGIKLNPQYVFSVGTPIQLESYINSTNVFLFDLDGTLVITDNVYIKVWDYILKKYNIFHDEDFFAKFIRGNNDRSVVSNLGLSISELSYISDMKNTKFIENIENIEIVKGAKEILRQAKKLGHKIGIVTNCNRCVAEKILAVCDLFKYVDVIVAFGETIKSKPYSEPYIKGANYFNVASHKVCIFEDSKTGILSGTGFSPKILVGISTTYGESELINLGCNLVLKDYSNVDPTMFTKYNNDDTKELEKNILDSLPKNTKKN